MKKRPIVFISLFCFAVTYAVLLLPKAFAVTFITLLTVTAVFGVLLLKKKQYLLFAVFVIVLLFCVVNPYLRYVRGEKQSQKFIQEVELKQDVLYTATVEECRTYSSFSQIFVKLETIDGVSINFRPKARLGCYSGTKLEKNDIVVFSGTPIQLSEIKETDFDTSTYLRSKNVFIDFPSITLISSSKAKHTPLLSRLSDYTEKVIYKFIPRNYNYDTASVCFAMFAGDRDFIPSKIKNAFSESGITHILCVSGMHLAILTGSVYFLLGALSVHKKLRCLLIIALCIFYTAFTGFSLSTIRACIMCTVGYLGMMFGKKTDGYISLFLSLLIICIISPYSALDISLLLSFLATLGILCAAELCPKFHGKSKMMRLICGFAGSIYCSMGAALFTLPICAFYFREFSFMSVISTLTVSLFVGILLISLMLLVIISPISKIAALGSFVFGIGGFCNTLCGVIIKCAVFFSSFRYSYGKAVFPEIHLCLFIIFAVLLTFFIIFDSKYARNYCLAAILLLNIGFSFMSLKQAVRDDNIYKITYYRKNENNRQISVKLAKYGYLLINADSIICTDKEDAPFDEKGGQNYLFIIPDNTISIPILAENIKDFGNRFGLKKVFLPENCTNFAKMLSNEGIECYFLPNTFSTGNIDIFYSYDENFYISIDDGVTKTGILFGDEYSKDSFEDGCDICAFFTRKTGTQFKADTHKIPNCGMFFTRLGKGESAKGITNTYGEKSITIKG